MTVIRRSSSIQVAKYCLLVANRTALGLNCKRDLLPRHCWKCCTRIHNARDNNERIELINSYLDNIKIYIVF